MATKNTSLVATLATMRWETISKVSFLRFWKRKCKLFPHYFNISCIIWRLHFCIWRPFFFDNRQKATWIFFFNLEPCRRAWNSCGRPLKAFCYKKVKRSIGILSKLRYYVDISILSKLYYALIYSVSLSWGLMWYELPPLFFNLYHIHS